MIVAGAEKAIPKKEKAVQIVTQTTVDEELDPNCDKACQYDEVKSSIV